MFWRGKDRLRFEQAVTLHLPALYQFAIELSGLHEAEDLVQAAVLRAWERRAMARPDRSLRPWLFGILRNTWVDQVRRRRRAERLAEAEAIPPVDDPSGDPSAVAAQNALAERVREALRALPEPFRWSVYLRDVEGFEYREIAEILDIPMGTVMSRIARGRALLRERLQDVAAERGIGLDRNVRNIVGKQRHDLS